MIRRGEVWWAELRDPAGAAPGYRRPMVVVQSDTFNRSRIATVVCVILTSNLRLLDVPGNVLVPKRVSGLPKDSVANVSRFVTLDRADLTERQRRIAPEIMRAITNGMKLVLEL